MKKSKPEWLNPEIFGINKLPGRELSWDAGAPEGALEDQTPFRITLDGQWPFAWYPDPDSVPEDWFLPQAEVSLYRPIKVPGVWELQGCGKPYYLAFDYPPAISKNRFRLPAVKKKDNPNGCYRYAFSLPETWKGRRLLIHFGGVKSAFYCYVNGKFAGYSQGSMTPAEFDITTLCGTGENLLAVRVIRFSDGTLLEDQDMWFLSGIFRSVYFFSEPVTGFSDFCCRSFFDASGKVTLRTRISFRNSQDSPADPVLRIFLVREGVTTLPDNPVIEKTVIIPVSGNEQQFDLDPGNPDLWTAETPNLYRLVFSLTTPDGRNLDNRSVLWGFREVRIEGTRLLVNGQAIFLRGINRHDFDPDTGWTISAERYEQDIRLLKGANINAVRTSHYPDDPLFYKLCDRHGLYVMDETDLETHGIRKLGIPGSRPEWRDAVVDRITRMVLRDRNRPSVIIWSLGNESGFGSNFNVMKQAARQLDDTRPFHYEGDTDLSVSDFFSRMYAHPDFVDRTGRFQDLPVSFTDRLMNLSAADNKPFRAEQYRDKPVLFCEFAHSMGNSLGNFGEFLDRMETYPNWCGGFIWDFADQSLRKRTPAGDDWLYGGDFGEEKTSGCFCANGIVSADRKPHPAWYEVRHVYQPVAVELSEGFRGMVRIRNKRCFVSLDDLELHWRLLGNGVTKAEGLQKLPYIRQGQTGELLLSGFPEKRPDEEGEYLLDLVFSYREEQSWCPAGTEAARIQLPLYTIEPRYEKAGLPLVFQNRQKDHVCCGRDWSLTIGKRSGMIESAVIGGQAVFTKPVTWNFWRPPTDNDKGFANFFPALEPLLVNRFWAVAAEKAVLKSLKTEGNQLVAVFRVPGCRLAEIRYSPDDQNEGLIVRVNVLPGKPLIRLGLTMNLDSRMEKVLWYGRGSHENYPDRARGAWLGIHESRPVELVHHYMRPQENGLRTGIRYLEVVDNDGIGLRIESGEQKDPGLSFSLWPWDADILEKARHQSDLVKGDCLVLNLDGFHQGVGGDFPAQLGLFEQFALPKNRLYRFCFRLFPQIRVPIDKKPDER